MDLFSDAMDEPQRHVLKLSCGLTVSMVVGEATGELNCKWSKRPTKKVLPEIEREYIPWRDEIIEAWAERTSQKVMVLTIK